jgi:antitoxin (DNA-binding transcriptional repressor) of toxin-antitoxin stability system
MQVITATNLARNTREVLDQVARTGLPLAVQRNHTLVAYIVPAQLAPACWSACQPLKAPWSMRRECPATQAVIPPR